MTNAQARVSRMPRLSTFENRSFSLPVLLVVGLLLVSGCRTYGNEGYDTGRKTYDALRTTIEQFDRERERAESDLQQLEEAAETEEALQALADQYHALVASHEDVLERYRREADALSAESSYRTLHQTYGALVTERRLLHRQYQRTTQKIWAAVRDTTVPPKSPRLRSRYTITPVQYPNQRQGRTRSMTEALRGLEGPPDVPEPEQEGT